MATTWEAKKKTTESQDWISTQLKYIYDAYRTAYLKKKYYGERLIEYQRYNYWMEIAIALGATGSGGVAGFAIWGTLAGHYVWLSISFVAALLGVIKPILQLGNAIENYTKLYAGHTGAYLDLRSIVEDINVKKEISEKMLDRYVAVKQTSKELGAMEEPKPKKTLLRELQNQINSEVPPESLWMPATG